MQKGVLNGSLYKKRKRSKIWWAKILHWGGTLQDLDLGRLPSQPLNGGIKKWTGEDQSGYGFILTGQRLFISKKKIKLRRKTKTPIEKR